MKRKPISLDDLRRSACAKLNGHLFAEPEKQPKRGKYGNVKTEVNGEVFDSAKEAEYYKTLLWRLKAGEIGLIERQVEYELNPGGTYSLKYYADFRFVDSQGITHVIDVKGFRTREYLKKKKLMWKVHKVKIEEI